MVEWPGALLALLPLRVAGWPNRNACDSLARPYGESVRYRETVLWPWWAVLTCAGLIALIGASFHRALGQILPWVAWPAVVIGVAMMCWALWGTRLRIRADRDGVYVNQAHLPAEYIGRVHCATGTEVRALRAEKSDARAFMAYRSWVRGAVLIEVLDEEDPHPYWLVSCRRPDILRDALTEERR